METKLLMVKLGLVVIAAVASATALAKPHSDSLETAVVPLFTFVQESAIEDELRKSDGLSHEDVIVSQTPYFTADMSHDFRKSDGYEPLQEANRLAERRQFEEAGQAPPEVGITLRDQFPEGMNASDGSTFF